LFVVRALSMVVEGEFFALGEVKMMMLVDDPDGSLALLGDECVLRVGDHISRW
jgi:hypothetical protein